MMHPLIIGLIALTCFIIILFAVGILFVVGKLIKNMLNLHNNAEWLNRHGKRIMATVVQVQTGQDWKYEEGWERDAWDGWQQKKSWQTYYDVTTRWKDSRTKRVYTFYSKVWSCEVTKQPVEGDKVDVIVDPRKPRRYRMDFHSIVSV